MGPGGLGDPPPSWIETRPGFFRATAGCPGSKRQHSKPLTGGSRAGPEPPFRQFVPTALPFGGTMR